VLGESVIDVGRMVAIFPLISITWFLSLLLSLSIYVFLNAGIFKIDNGHGVNEKVEIENVGRSVYEMLKSYVGIETIITLILYLSTSIFSIWGGLLSANSIAGIVFLLLLPLFLSAFLIPVQLLFEKNIKSRLERVRKLLSKTGMNTPLSEKITINNLLKSPNSEQTT